jgi:hypothetical protein
MTAVSSESAVPGAALAVSPDGRFLAIWVHTMSGADLTVRNRDTGTEHRIELPAQSVPPGVAWRIVQARFSPNGHWLVVHSVGRLWVADPVAGRLVYSIGPSEDGNLWPGGFTMSNARLGVTFWQPQSVVQDQISKRPPIFDIYDLATGRGLRAIALDAHSSAAWLEADLSPDDKWLLLLERSRTWAGKAQVSLLVADSGQLVWRRKYAVDTAGWENRDSNLLALGGHLLWLSAQNGEMIHDSGGADASSSQFRRLRFNEASGVALGLLFRYKPLQQMFSQDSENSPLAVLWRIDTLQELCRTRLKAGMNVDGWVTAGGEIITLEETYIPRSATYRPTSARIVTYRLVPSIRVASAPAARRQR